MSKYTDQFIDMDAVIWATNLFSVDSTPKEPPGILRRVFRPGYGMGTYRYVQNKVTAGLTVGQSVCFVNSASPPTITASGTGTTTSIVTTGLTANEYKYDLCICKNDAGSAGGAPEGTGGFVTDNTTTKVSIDSDSPFTAATASTDTFEVITNCKVILCATNDLQNVYAGVVMADALPDDYWHWVFVRGRCSKVALKSAITLAPTYSLIAETGVLTVAAAATLSLLFGQIVHTVSNDAGRMDFGVADIYGYLPEYGNGQLVALYS